MGPQNLAATLRVGSEDLAVLCVMATLYLGFTKGVNR